MSFSQGLVFKNASNHTRVIGTRVARARHFERLEVPRQIPRKECQDKVRRGVCPAGCIKMTQGRHLCQDTYCGVGDVVPFITVVGQMAQPVQCQTGRRLAEGLAVGLSLFRLIAIPVHQKATRSRLVSFL
jgi:hypothetical protein